MASEQSARERMLEQAEAEIRLNANGNCADCFGDDAAPLEWRHYPGCYATVNKALDLALARIAELERERDAWLRAYGPLGPHSPSEVDVFLQARDRVNGEVAAVKLSKLTAALELANARVRDLERERDEAKQIAADYIARTDPILDQLEPLHDRVRELTRERDEARAKLPRTDLPRRAYVLTINVDGHTWDDALREMEEMFWHVRDHGPECSSVGGGGHAGHVVTVNHDPSITPERHGEWLNEWLEARKDEREKGSE